MLRHSRLMLATLAGAAILAAAVGSASANRLSITNSSLIRTTWTSVRFRNSMNANAVLCPLTLEGSFHSTTITKTVDQLIGYVTKARLANEACMGGHATVFQESLPWHIQYHAMGGILPNITLLIFRLLGPDFRIQPTGESACNMRAEASHPALGTVNLNSTTHVAESFTPEPNTRIPLESGLCALAEGSLEEASQTFTAGNGSTAKITIALI